MPQQDTVAHLISSPDPRRARRRNAPVRAPPLVQAKFGAYYLCLVKHDTVRFEQGVNIAGGAARVVSEGHRSGAEHVDVRYHAALGQPVTQASEGLFDGLAAE